MSTHKIATREEWLAARKALLAKEKEQDRRRDEISAARRELPWVEVTTKYEFDAADGKKSLRDLFGAHRQLFVYHFMLDPSWEAGCKSCSFVSDTLEGAYVHLRGRDTAFTAISRAPLAKIEAFKKRMGWTFPWVSSFGTSFNHDFHVTVDDSDVARGAYEYNYRSNPNPKPGELPGASTFAREGDRVFHVYSTYSRGLDLLIGTYNMLDMTPYGRDEGDRIMGWVRHHDKYE